MAITEAEAKALTRFFGENMPLTTRAAQESATGIRFPYTVPGVIGFRNFFYWDTYFANWGLLSMEMYGQVKNNLLNMADFVDRFGYIPNADVLLNRSQPPLFTRAVYDYAEASGDREIIAALLPAMVREHAFWQERRLAPCGLNRYGDEATEQELRLFNKEIAERLGLAEEDLKEGFSDRNLLAAAESGWDFSSRFFDGRQCIAAQLCPVDLNAILFDAERKLAAFAEEVGERELAATFTKTARERAERMYALMYDEERGLFFDYDFLRCEKRRGPLHAASFAPAAFGVDLSQGGLGELLAALEGPYGLTVCERNACSERFQWDFPFMWAPITAIACEGLYAAGLNEDAARVMKKYCDTVEENFFKTGNLWEKYNVVSGERGDSCEYETPPMLGWTAGVYLRFRNLIEKFGF